MSDSLTKDEGAKPLFTYVVGYGGGVGPNVWDGEKIVRANSLRAALDLVEQEINDQGGEVFVVEQQ